MKGLMVYTHEIDQLINSPKELKRVMDIGIDTFFPVVKNYDGRIYFKSASENFSGDKLTPFIETVKRKGFFVYAWLCILTEGYCFGPFSNQGPSPILLKNPSWACISSMGLNTLEKPIVCDGGWENYVCPSHGGLRLYIESLVKELVLSNSVDGIFLDLVRYPLDYENFCYCQGCYDIGLKLFGQKELSKEQKCSIKSFLINTLVNNISHVIQKYGDGQKLGALVWDYPFAKSIGQDWKMWELNFLSPLYYAIKNIKDKFSFDQKMYSHQFIPMIGDKLSHYWDYNQWVSFLDFLYQSQISYIIGHYGLKNIIARIYGGRSKGYNKSMFIKKDLKILVKKIMGKRFVTEVKKRNEARKFKKYFKFLNRKRFQF